LFFYWVKNSNQSLISIEILPELANYSSSANLSCHLFVPRMTENKNISWCENMKFKCLCLQITLFFHGSCCNSRVGTVSSFNWDITNLVFICWLFTKKACWSMTYKVNKSCSTIKRVQIKTSWPQCFVNVLTLGHIFAI
jgi:hypothetical protein